MRAGHPHICLFEPEIPQNAGNIGRLAAATGCRLHMVKPFGFSTSDKHLRRSGLDYWPFLDLEVHENLEGALKVTGGQPAFLSKFATRPFYEIPITSNILIFGRETTGLPPKIRTQYSDFMYSIPMFHPGVRSLNLANAVAIVVYNQLLQRGLMRNS